jgi:hypothetical protein
MYTSNGTRMVMLVVYFILGLYLINFAFQFVSLGNFFLKLDKWIFTVCGALILWNGLSYYRRASMGM